MAKNHPIRNTVLVRNLREAYKGHPTEWIKVYKALKVVWDSWNEESSVAHPNKESGFSMKYVCGAFTWDKQPQGLLFWADVSDFQYLRRNHG